MHLIQVSTCAPLCKSKGYYETESEVLDHVKKVAAATEKFRQKMEAYDLIEEGYGQNVTQHDIDRGVRIINVDLEQCNAALKLLGPTSPIKDPFVYPFPSKRQQLKDEQKAEV